MKSTAELLSLLEVLIRTLRPALGWKTVPFLVRWAAHLPRLRRRYLGTNADPAIEECKETFLPLAAIHHELAAALGEERAAEISQTVALGVAASIQRRWYLPAISERSWDQFHREHERQMRQGLVRHNEHAASSTLSGEKVEFQITRCRFHEAFRELGTPALTEAFCRSDEIVFNEYLPSMRFHRGGGGANTIARGAPACKFVFERAALETGVEATRPPEQSS
jgi:hypothetical protein